jgi:hypothetical protein
MGCSDIIILLDYAMNEVQEGYSNYYLIIVIMLVSLLLLYFLGFYIFFKRGK